LEGAFKGVHKQKPDVVMVMQSPSLDGLKDQILQLTHTYRLPVVAVFANFTAGGALLNYGPNIEDLVVRSAGYVDKILRGMRPGDLPIQRPTKFDLVVNAKTAKLFGITIPEPILARADQIIQ
jgi:putative ABC transport system substrate-binding protein